MIELKIGWTYKRLMKKIELPYMRKLDLLKKNIIGKGKLG